ncbi:MAG: hypothetical protein WC867_05790 [Candidatus Pacearchaeota archaeon]|jgi:hypothetical protein
MTEVKLDDVRYNKFEQFLGYVYGFGSGCEISKGNYLKGFGRAMTFFGLNLGYRHQKRTGIVDRRGFLVAGLGNMVSASATTVDVAINDDGSTKYEDLRTSGVIDIGLSFCLLYKHYSSRREEIEKERRQANKSLSKKI